MARGDRSAQLSGGRLVLCGTPIGNLGDATDRLRDVLAAANVIAAEDTRRARQLLSALEIETSARLVSCYDATEAARAAQLVEAAQGGQLVALVTDAGMPAVSDPGYRVVAAFVEAGVPVTCAPGPSSVTTALALSGLPSDRWCMEGFLPRSGAERKRRIAELATDPRTVVLLESPHRIGATLGDLAAAMGDGRPAALCRELTKLHEEVVRASLSELVAWSQSKEIKGEVTLVVGGATQPEARTYSPEELADLADATGLRGKEAVAEVARVTGVSKKVVYDAVLAGKNR
jgi:16S rRNA (cytidine1402-2'-O)-methyltransferase